MQEEEERRGPAMKDEEEGEEEEEEEDLEGEEKTIDDAGCMRVAEGGTRRSKQDVCPVVEMCRVEMCRVDREEKDRTPKIDV